MWISVCLKSTECVWEPLSLQVDLPAGAAPPLKPGSAKPGRWSIGHVLPPWTSKPHQLKELWILSSWQNANSWAVQYIEHDEEQDACEQLLEGQRWVETFALFFMSIMQLLAGLCSQLTKEQRKTEIVAYRREEACVCICKGLGIQRLFTTAASFIMGNFSTMSFPTCQKDNLRVFSCP